MGAIPSAGGVHIRRNPIWCRTRDERVDSDMTETFVTQPDATVRCDECRD